MPRWIVAVSIAALACGACSRDPANNSAANGTSPPIANEGGPASARAPTDGDSSVENVSLPNDRAPLEEPTGPIDPKSAEAAGQVVQHYGALIEQKRWDEAAKLWGSSEAAAKFDAALKSNRENHLEIGNLGRPEGAAGSIYLSVPVTLYGKDAQGKAFRIGQTVILRRVNDVPGSTEAQRRWHVERIDAGSGA